MSFCIDVRPKTGKFYMSNIIYFFYIVYYATSWLRILYKKRTAISGVIGVIFGEKRLGRERIVEAIKSQLKTVIS